MRAKTILTITLAAALLAFRAAFGFQVESDSLKADSTAVATNDTICYELDFAVGDTLYYRVESRDSVLIGRDEPLTKKRYERIRIVCDSIKNGRFFLSQTLTQFMAYESKGDVKDVKREESPWVGRTVWYEIDSLGNRYNYGYDDSLTSALTPGGAFQPAIIFPFKRDCRAKNKTWIVETLDELPENGLPVPLMNQSSLFRAISYVDTLDERCARFQYIKTGQGSYKVVANKDTIKATCRVNGFGRYDISVEKKVPLAYYATIEQKLRLFVGEKQTKVGWHYLNSEYVLDRYLPAIKKEKVEPEK